jgi:general secretion pathway protein H
MNPDPGRLVRPWRGLTLIELLLVLAVVGLAAALAIPALRDPARSNLQNEAVRLAALLEGARAASRAYDETLTWQLQGGGFRFLGQAGGPWPTQWLHAETEAQVLGGSGLTLGPEPIIAPQTVLLRHRQRPELMLWVHTNGVRPFEVLVSPTLPQQESRP